MTFREILLENSFEEFGHIIKTNLESKICENNKKVLEILENKNDANFDIILNLKIKDIFNEYLISDEFKKNIEHLEEGENAEYIIKYIKIANNMADFFLL
jgi:ethanolamine ammonia-lyase large subunit